MKKELIFKCFAQGEWWYVYEVNYGLLGVRYRIYKGRRWFSHATFETRKFAILAAVNAVTADMRGCNYKLNDEV